MSSEQDLEFTELDLRPHFAVIRKHNKLILAVTAAAVALMSLFSLLSPRTWTATSTVAVPQPPAIVQPEVVGGVQAVVPSVVYSQATYARLITSSTLSEMVIKRLHLQLSPEALAKMIRATPIRDTLLIGITVNGSDGQQTQDIANALGDSLVEYERRVVTTELSQGRQFVETQLARTRADLQAREAALKAFNERENLAALQATLNQQLTNLTNLRQLHEQNKIDLGIARQRLAQVEQELASTRPLRVSGTSTQVNTLGASAATQLRAQLADLNAQRAQLLQQYTPSYPAVVAVQAKIEQTQKALADAERREPSSTTQETNSVRVQLEGQRATQGVEVASLEARDRLLSLAIPQAEQHLQALNIQLAEKNAEVNQLSRALGTAKTTFSTLTTKATEAIVAEGMQRGFVRVVDRAAVRPAPKGTLGKVTLAALLGLILGALAAFTMEYFSTHVLPTPAVPSATKSRDGTSQIVRHRADVAMAREGAVGEETAKPALSNTTTLGS